jgi:hypothetical protein
MDDTRHAVTPYTLAALADVPLLILGYLFVRRFHERLVGLTSAVAVLVMLGGTYLLFFLALVLPSCPGNRWAC